MSLACLPILERYLRDESIKKGIRIDEFFLDFDKLRSGYVATNNFFRILDNTTRMPLSKQHREAIINEYGDADGGRIKWKRFVEDVVGKFDPNDFKSRIEDKLNSNLAIDAEPAKKGLDEKIQAIFARIRKYIDYRGIILSECYKQFDPTNNGCITESQFFRFFPGPPDITEAEKSALCRAYASKAHLGMVDYFRLEHELMAATHPMQTCSGNLNTEKFSQEDPFLTITFLMNRLKYAAFKNRLRTVDFFKQFDKHNHDSITASQFACALNSAFAKALKITEDEIAGLVNVNSRNDGLVSYRSFCAELDAAFQTLHLHKDPQMTPQPVHEHDFDRTLDGNMNANEMRRLDILLNKIREFVQKSRSRTYDFFIDFDIGAEAQTGYITDTQMSRVLKSFLGLDLSSEDFQLVADRFRDPVRGLVNYRHLCHCIDEDIRFSSNIWDPKSTATTLEAVPGSVSAGEARNMKSSFLDLLDLKSEKALHTVADVVPVEDILQRIRHICLVNRINLRNFFQDDDPLRSNRMSKPAFLRCLTRAGLNRLELQEFSPEIVQKLLLRYEVPEDPLKVHWTQFVEEIDQVFTEPGLEKQPLKRIPDQISWIRPPEGTVNWETSASPELKANCKSALEKMRRIVMERRMLVKPDFQAMDPLNHGHCTVNQFHKLMSMLNMRLTQEQEMAVAARFSDDHGFNYFDLLTELDPQVVLDGYAYPRLLAERQANCTMPGLNDVGRQAYDAESVMQKLKTQVYLGHLRMSEFFRDHDQSNHGRLPRITFRRAMGQSPLKITEKEISLLESKYLVEGEIDWRHFCRDMDEAFILADHLEKDPLKPMVQFKPVHEVDEDQDICQARLGIIKMAKVMKQRRIDLKWAFQDFDAVNRGTVTPNQFQRVLKSHGIADFVTSREWNALLLQFRHPLDFADHVNYISFLRELNHIADTTV